MAGYEGKPKKNVLFFAAGTNTGGGSGFRECVEFSRTTPAVLHANVAGVVSNYPEGGVFEIAKYFNVPFECWQGPFEAEGYRYFVEKYKADYVMLSGWLKFVLGLEIGRTINIHPGPLGEFGGKGFHGHFVHEAVYKAFKEGRITQTAVTMSFIDPEKEYDDDSLIIYQHPILLREDDTAETIASRVNEKERTVQAMVLNRVVNGDIYYHDGKVFWHDKNPKDIHNL